jgi:hypothetical protein
MKQFLCATLLLTACASTGSDGSGQAAGGKGTPIQITFVDYRTGATMELVNESHTSKLEQYSTPRSNASRKVQSDELVGQLVEYMDDNGYQKLAVPGDPPYLTGGQFYWTLQIVEPDRRSYVAEGRTTTLADKQRVRAFSQAFLGVYNLTDGWQAVEVAPGEMPFKGPNLPTQKGGKR